MFVFLLAVSLITNQIGERFWKMIDLGKYREVIDTASVYLKEGRLDKKAMLALAYAYRVEGKFDSALSIYTRILKVNPDDFDALDGLAFTLSWKGDLDSAVAVYKKMFRLYKYKKDVLTGLARTYGWMGDMKDAKRWIKIAVKKFPESSDVYELCGDIYTWDGKLKKAVNCYKKALSKSPKNVDLMIKVAQNYEWQNDVKNAILWYRKALQLDPTNSKALKGLKRVSKLRYPVLSVKYSHAKEIDSTTTTYWNNLNLFMHHRLFKTLTVSMRIMLDHSIKNDSSSTKVYFQPGISLLFLPFQFTVAPGFGSTSLLYSSLIFKFTPLKIEGKYLEEILEPIELIKINHFELNGELDIAAFKLKGGYDYGKIPFDDNTRKLIDLSIERNLLTEPVLIKFIYSYGYKNYQNWSPYYYSPSDFHQHSIGAMFFKSFGKGYIYFDMSKSFYGSPGTFSSSAEVGFRNFYVSVSIFKTTENYEYLNVNTGLNTRISF